MSEAQIIDFMRSAGAGRDDVTVGIGDDAAVVEVPAGRRLVVCVDALLADVHFPASTEAHDLGWRSLAVNLSDLAAMGAEPAWATLVLSLPEANEAWIKAFARGFSELARHYDVALIGGDTVRGPLAVTVQLLGLAAGTDCMLRSGARRGDDVWVSGSVGDAAAGLALLKGKIKADKASTEFLCRRFLRPTARVELGRQLVGIVNATIDVSDGLYTDAARLAKASNVGMILNMEDVPISPALAAVMPRNEALQMAASGGDDYELLFAASAKKRSEIQAAAASLNMSCSRIGTVTDGETVTCVLESEPWMPSHTGYEHFVAGGDH